MVHGAQEADVANEAGLVHHAGEEVKVEGGLGHLLLQQVEVLRLHGRDDGVCQRLCVLHLDDGLRPLVELLCIGVVLLVLVQDDLAVATLLLLHVHRGLRVVAPRLVPLLVQDAEPLILLLLLVLVGVLLDLGGLFLLRLFFPLRRRRLLLALLQLLALCLLGDWLILGLFGVLGLLGFHGLCLCNLLLHLLDHGCKGRRRRA
mmetsp:Transcript_78625/g.254706  ORF Transcript_78625/g.254706 Transcript_78625/m.254706 type:complete len:203 (+) Transcript_78625:2665-3273(+)